MDDDRFTAEYNSMKIKIIRMFEERNFGPEDARDTLANLLVELIEHSDDPEEEMKAVTEAMLQSSTPGSERKNI